MVRMTNPDHLMYISDDLINTLTVLETKALQIITMY